MTKRALPTLAALGATAAVVLAAILLPPKLSLLADRSRLNLLYSEDIGSAEVSYVPKLTSAQRQALLHRLFLEDETLSVMDSPSPAENEIQEAQVPPLIHELLRQLQDTGAIPCDTSFPLSLELSFDRVVDRENPSLYLSLWSVQGALVSTDSKTVEYPYSCFFRLFMEAETGAVYFLALYSHEPVGTAEAAAQAVCAFSGFTLEECVPEQEDSLFSVQLERLMDAKGEDIVRYQVSFQTPEQETVNTFLFLSEHSVLLAPF